MRANRPAGPGEAGPAVGGSNNSPGRPDVRVVGRSPQPAKPIRWVKSRIVPEPDQATPTATILVASAPTNPALTP